MVAMRLRVLRLLRAGVALPVAALAASPFLPWRLMDLRERGRVIGVESWFVVRRWIREKHRDNRKPPCPENHVIISGSVHTATSTAEMWGLPKSGDGDFQFTRK
jgi:hypothetical protein